MQRKIFKTGHSAAVTLSHQALDKLGLKLGDDVKIEVDEAKGQIVIRPGNKNNQLALNLHSRPKLGSSINR